MDEAICKILSRAALCFSHKITEPRGLPPQQQPALKARTLSISRLNLPVCCCDKDTVMNQTEKLSKSDRQSLIFLLNKFSKLFEMLGRKHLSN